MSLEASFSIEISFISYLKGLHEQMKNFLILCTCIFFMNGCASNQQTQQSEGNPDNSKNLDLMNLGICMMSGTSPYVSQNMINCRR